MTIRFRKALHAYNTRPRIKWPSVETVAEILAGIATIGVIVILYLEA